MQLKQEAVVDKHSLVVFLKKLSCSESAGEVFILSVFSVKCWCTVFNNLLKNTADFHKQQRVWRCFSSEFVGRAKNRVIMEEKLRQSFIFLLVDDPKLTARATIYRCVHLI